MFCVYINRREKKHLLSVSFLVDPYETEYIDSTVCNLSTECGVYIKIVIED